MSSRFLNNSVFLAIVLFAVSVPSFGRRITPVDPAEDPPQKADAVTTPSDPSPELKFSRWLDLNTLSFSMRYRSSAENSGYHLFQYGQERSLADGRLKLDSQGKYSVHFHLSSGDSFNWAYADVIGGSYGGQSLRSLKYLTPADLNALYTGVYFDSQDYKAAAYLHSRGWDMRMRELYLSASPIKQIEFQYGSLAISRGFDTEMTTYDDDGYLDGGRLRILDPAHFYVDEISATVAYEGDIFDPNFFTRGNRLLQSNYHQFLLAKKFSKRIGLSADYTEDKATHTWRQGVLLNTSETRVLDSLRVESYERTNTVIRQEMAFAGGSGFGFTASKTLMKRVRLEGGYADIDYKYGALVGSRLLATFGFSMNGDAYLTGKRIFTRANVQITPYFSLFGYFTHETVPSPIVNPNSQSFNFGGTLDFQNILSTKFHLFGSSKQSNGL